MKWILIWLIFTPDADGVMQASTYKTEMSSQDACYEAQTILDAKLLSGRHTNFITECAPDA